jgi:hypothetical protein
MGVLFSVLGLACGADYDHTDITSVKASDLGGGIDKTTLSIPEGLILKAHVDSKNDDNKSMGLSIRSLDPTVVEVAGVISDHDYAFIGRKQGRTQIEFKADDTVVLTVDALVTPQPSTP